MEIHKGDVIHTGFSGPAGSLSDGPCPAGDDVSSSFDAMDRKLAALLAEDESRRACDAVLEEPSDGMIPAVRDRLVGARECLDLLRRAWPREDSIPGMSGLPDDLSDPSEDSSRGSGNSDTARENPGSEGAPEPRKIGRFTILGELGHGGFGIVYLALDPALGREVALKLPRLETLASRDLRRRFLAEARVAARLDHPNIVPIYDVGELGDGRGSAGIYIASAYCREGPLSAWIARQGAATALDQVARMMIGLAEGVRHLHELGILHRDLKPSNVLLQRRTPGTGAEHDPEYVPRVADFGLARLMEQPLDHTQTGTPIGSPPYMSPEQARGQVRELGPATDVYGLGAILYVLLCGRPPFRGESTTETICQVVQDEPIPPRRLRPGLPRDLETICLTCLRKEPERRYPCAAALRDDLGRFLRGEPIHARPVSTAERLAKWALRHKAIATLVAVLAVTVLVGSTAVVSQWRKAVGLNESLRRQVYLERMNRAARAWDSGHVEQARELLEETVPEPGGSDLRGFEWFHLARLCRGDEVNLVGHEGSVKSLAIGDGGRILVSCGEDRAIKVWDLAGRKLIRSLKPVNRSTLCLTLSKDGQFVFLGGHDGIIRQVEISAGKVVRRLEGHSGMVLDLAIGNDGRRLASAGQDQAVRVWDLDTGRSLKARAPGNAVSAAVALSPDGKTFAFQDGASIRIQDASDGRSIVQLHSRRMTVRDLAFRPDGQEIAAADAAGMIAVWNLPSGVMTRLFHSPGGAAFNALAYSPDGTRLVAGGYDDVATVWDVSGDRCLEVYRGHVGTVTCLAFAPDGQTVVTGSADHVIKIWEPVSGSFPRSLAAHPAAIRCLRYSPDGTRLASGDRDGRIRIWDRRNGNTVAGREQPSKSLTWLEFSPDGQTLALASNDGTVTIWSPGQAAARHLSGLSGAVSRVAFSPEGRRLATADESQTIKVWDPEDGRLLQALARAPGQIVALAFTPDGSGLFAGGSDGRLSCWDPGSGRSIETRQLPFREVRTLFMDLASRRIAVASMEQSLDLYDLDVGRTIHPLQRRGPRIMGVTLTAESSRVLTAGDDGCVRVWDTRLGKELAHFKISPLPLKNLTLRPDGKELATGDQAGMIRLLTWPDPP